MAKAKKQKQTADNEIDSVFFLKLVMYMVLGSLWIKVVSGDSLQIPIPIGLIVGLILTTHEHFKIDRKIEYAVLLISMMIGFWAPIGLYINM